MTTSEAFAGFFGVVLAAIALAVFVAFMATASGFVVWQLWNWHATPFTDIRLSLPQAVGACALLSALKGWRRPSKENDDRVIVSYLTFLSISLLIGWVAHLFA